MPSLLDKFNINLEDLNAAERQTYLDWVKKLSQTQITVADIKTYAERTNTAIQNEMAGITPPESFWHWLFRSRRETYLRARLKNNLMFLDFMTGPDKAQKWVEQQLQQIKPSN